MQIEFMRADERYPAAFTLCSVVKEADDAKRKKNKRDREGRKKGASVLRKAYSKTESNSQAESKSKKQERV